MSASVACPRNASCKSCHLLRIIPQSDDGAVLYLQEPGRSVGKRSEHVVVKKDGKEMTRVPMHAIRQVVVCGNVQVSTQALETLTANDIAVSYVTGQGRFIGSFVPAPAKNVSLREAQFKKFSDPAACLELSKAVVRAKLNNQRALLMRSLRGEVEARGSHEVAARGIYGLLGVIDDQTSVESVLGIEGRGAAWYFGEFGRFLNQPPTGKGFDFTTRNRRPPRDPVNALLSQGRHGKPSLALDLMEEFRPVIADSVVLTLINTEPLTPGTNSASLPTSTQCPESAAAVAGRTPCTWRATVADACPGRGRRVAGLM